MYLFLKPVIFHFLTGVFFKNNCLELEKEIEELSSKPVAGGTDDVIKVTKQCEHCFHFDSFTYRKWLMTNHIPEASAPGALPSFPPLLSYTATWLEEGKSPVLAFCG